VVVVKAALAVAAVFPLGGESTGDGLGDPVVFFLAIASCFIVDTLAHLEEGALGIVSATLIEVGDPAAATATLANLFVLAFPPVGGVRVSVVATQFAKVNDGARRGYFGFGCGREEAFGGAEVSVAPVGP